MTDQLASRKHDVIGFAARDHEHLTRCAGVRWWLRIKEATLVADFDPNFLDDG
ncbi:MAG: hypothetical protein JOZ17_16710 [Acetobacteraceae bacterium]|nr:hypothetical protein [Acetobacteraceae bacterium]